MSALLLAIASLCFTRIYLHIFPASIVKIQTLSTKRINVNPTVSSITINPLVSLTAHNKAENPKPIESSVDGSALVDTRLNVKLVGVVDSNDPNSSRAVIAIDDKQAVYSSGSQLLPYQNVYLFKVMIDHVIINNNGQYERLWLYDSKTPNVIAELTEPSEAFKDTPYVYNGPPNGYDEDTFYHPNVADEEQALAEVNRNLADLVTMSIQRIEGNNQVKGYKIQPGRDAAKFNEAGLQTNDMITAINGIPVTKPDEILESYKSMGTTPITLELERGDSVINLEVNQTLQ